MKKAVMPTQPAARVAPRQPQPQADASRKDHLSDMYRAGHGVEPYPAANKPPKMNGGARGW